MGKYFLIQIKRLGRILPIVLCVMAVLFGGIYFAYKSLVAQWSDPSKFGTISVGVVGTANDRMLNLGLNALQSIDATDVSVELVPMEESQANISLQNGSISAYVVFPEGFMDNADRNHKASSLCQCRRR